MIVQWWWGQIMPTTLLLAPTNFLNYHQSLSQTLDIGSSVPAGPGGQGKGLLSPQIMAELEVSPS